MLVLNEDLPMEEVIGTVIFGNAGVLVEADGGGGV